MIKKFFLPALIVSVGLFMACGGEHKEAASDAATQQLAVVDTIHAYICPMHCENSASMEPGVCKVCGMELVKNPDYKGEVTATPDSASAATTDSTAHDHEDHEGHNH